MNHKNETLTAPRVTRACRVVGEQMECFANQFKASVVRVLRFEQFGASQMEQYGFVLRLFFPPFSRFHSASSFSFWNMLVRVLLGVLAVALVSSEPLFPVPIPVPYKSPSSSDSNNHRTPRSDYTATQHGPSSTASTANDFFSSIIRLGLRIRDTARATFGYGDNTSSGYEYEAPNSGYEPPASEYGAPANEYEPPAEEYGPPAEEYGPPANEYEAPANEYGPPAEEYGPPASEYEAPASEYGVPANEYEPSPYDYSPPAEEYGPPAEEYGPPANEYDYSPPAEEYGPPALEHGTPENVYEPPEEEYGFPSNGYLPPPNKYGPPEEEYGSPETEYSFPEIEYSSPDNEYGPPIIEYGTPENEYAPPEEEYGPPENEYAAPENEYAAPENEEYNDLDHYIAIVTYQSTPAPSYDTPDQSYNTPAPSYNTAAQSYTTRAPTYTTPAPTYTTPAPTYNPPAKEYKEPTNDYKEKSKGPSITITQAKLIAHSKAVTGRVFPFTGHKVYSTQTTPAPKYSPEPKYTTPAPTYTTSAPSYTTEAPVYTTKAPVYTTTNSYTTPKPRYTTRSRYNSALSKRNPANTNPRPRGSTSTSSTRFSFPKSKGQSRRPSSASSISGKLFRILRSKSNSNPKLSRRSRSRGSSRSPISRSIFLNVSPRRSQPQKRKTAQTQPRRPRVVISPSQSTNNGFRPIVTNTPRPTSVGFRSPNVNHLRHDGSPPTPPTITFGGFRPIIKTTPRTTAVTSRPHHGGGFRPVITTTARPTTFAPTTSLRSHRTITGGHSSTTQRTPLFRIVQSNPSFHIPREVVSKAPPRNQNRIVAQIRPGPKQPHRPAHGVHVFHKGAPGVRVHTPARPPVHTSARPPVRTPVHGTYRKSQYHFSWKAQPGRVFTWSKGDEYCTSLGPGWELVSLELPDENFYISQVVARGMYGATRCWVMS
ncbi:DNA-directed RNA polymerase subunit beta'' [Portunus trituberculatus]|uniref:DNA-directed RNA polymerase subunit beta n=1 Tax=Portunus trituberculatus TaxID=210409 RepID=A0A5B7FQV7_PORTR|nr:DNA-directed RNA polymerase subunit beta'' [Portunus trituberculatus]